MNFVEKQKDVRNFSPELIINYEEIIQNKNCNRGSKISLNKIQ